jgi:hypothetical protein
MQYNERQTLRASVLLDRIASYLADILRDGMPEEPKGIRSEEERRNALSAYQEWYDERYYSVEEAREFLKAPEDCV